MKRLVLASVIVVCTGCSKKSAASTTLQATPKPQPSEDPSPPTPSGPATAQPQAPSPPSGKPPSPPPAKPELATQLVITSNDFSAVADACIPISIATEDASGTQQVLLNNHGINLLSSSSDGEWYSDPLCSDANQLTSLVLQAGTASGTVFYEDGNPGTPQISAVDTFSPALATALQTGTISIGPPSQLAFLNQTLQQPANTCGPFTILVEDAGGNPTANGSEIDLFLLTSSASGTFYSDSQCANPATLSFNAAAFVTSIAAGSGSATAYYKDATAGNPALTITPDASFGQVVEPAIITASGS